MMIEIEKNVPIPARKSSVRNKKYPFELMEVGDSFFVPERSVKTFGSTVSAAARRTGYKFATRQTAEHGQFGERVEGVRVWRVENTDHNEE